MRPETILGENDTRDLVRLLGKVAAENGTLAHKRNLLMAGLCKMIDVDCWHWSMLGNFESGELPSFSVYLRGGFEEQQFAEYLKAQEHPDMAILQAPLAKEFLEKGTHLTRLRQQIDKEGVFLKSAVYEQWRKADIAPLILSMRPTSSGQISAVSLFRRFDRDLFTVRESRIAHIVLSEVSWLHEEAWPKHPKLRVKALSPRLHTVMNMLLQGYVRKEIAHSLGISVNTVSGYVKDLYRHFEVHSQADLIRRFVEGDGGDIPDDDLLDVK